MEDAKGRALQAFSGYHQIYQSCAGSRTPIPEIVSGGNHFPQQLQAPELKLHVVYQGCGPNVHSAAFDHVSLDACTKAVSLHHM